jgi:hypothetical protein
MPATPPLLLFAKKVCYMSDEVTDFCRPSAFIRIDKTDLDSSNYVKRRLVRCERVLKDRDLRVSTQSMKTNTPALKVSPRFSPRLTPILIAVALIVWCPLQTRANLIVNPGFETGTFTGWTFNPGPSSASGVDNSNPHTGTYAAVLDATTGPPPVEELSQTVATTPGTFYDVSFWLSNSASAGSRSFIASFGGTTIALGGSPAFPYTEFAFSVQATGSSSVMDFRDFNNGGAWYLDDISVTPRSVPDNASTWMLLLLGVSATFGLNLRWPVARL